MKKGILFFLFLSGCTFSGRIELSDLKGKTPEEVKDFFGQPIIIRHEGDKLMWAYKEKDCHHLIFFDETNTVQFAESRGNCLQN